MDWRKPEAWPRPLQRASWGLALLVGFVAVSPFWLRAWQAWREAEAALAQFEAMLADTQALGRQSLRMQAMSEPAPAPQTLRPTPVSMDKVMPSAATDALQVQQWPIHLHVAGAWASWSGWLTQWPTAMPGVTMTSLDLRANVQGGVTAQVGLLSPRVLPPLSPLLHVDEVAQAATSSRDPFDAKAWQQTQVLHAQHHQRCAERGIRLRPSHATNCVMSVIGPQVLNCRPWFKSLSPITKPVLSRRRCTVCG